MIDYRPGSELWQYEAGSVVKGVPVSYFDNDKDAMEYRQKHQNSQFWRDNVAKLTANFDPMKFGPVYYCLNCRRLEDGAHRLIVAEKRGLKTIGVQVGDVCYKHVRVDKDKSVLEVFYDAMEELPTSHRLDRAWLNACAKSKWPLFGAVVDFRGKTFLDVGCNVGYSCIEAWRRGASGVFGIDVRRDVLAVAERVKAILNVPGLVQFYGIEWKAGVAFQKFDIVMIMGLLHYFPKGQYEAILKGLCDTCNETLILELRIMGSNRPKLMAVGRQTLPTTQWLQDKLNKFGFLPVKRVIRDKQRELWVCERST